MVKILIWPVALYGCEIGTLLTAEINKLQAKEMWLQRRLERVDWRDMISNEVLTMVNETRCLITPAHIFTGF